MRKMLSIVVALVLIGLCVANLEVTLLSVVFATVFAAALFGVFYACKRGTPIKSERTFRNEPTSKRLLRDLYYFALAAIIGSIALIYPELFRAMIDAVWPFLGGALFMLASSLYVLIRQD